MPLEIPDSTPQRDSRPGPGPLHDERRSSPRKKLQVGIGLHSDSQIFVGYSEDLSDGGVFVATYQRLEPGSPVALDLELPTGATVSCRGRVAWVRDGSDLHRPGLGVAFEELSSAARDAIVAFTREHPPLFYDLEAVLE